MLHLLRMDKEHVEPRLQSTKTRMLFKVPE